MPKTLIHTSPEKPGAKGNKAIGNESENRGDVKVASNNLRDEIADTKNQTSNRTEKSAIDRGESINRTNIGKSGNDFHDFKRQ